MLERRKEWRLRALARGVAVLSCAVAASAQTRPGRPDPRAPRLRTDLAAHTEVEAGGELAFRVEARDPDGGPVDLVLLNPPPGLVFDPLRGARSPAAVRVRWTVPDETVGPLTLVFEARDAQGLRATLARALDARTSGRSAVVVGDVTGDGVLDVVAAASSADVAGVVDAGALYVWAGASAPNGAPTATLSVPGASEGDQLGAHRDACQALRLADVTGDGVDDVVAVAPYARIGGARDGAVYVFEGGAALVGDVAPRATLTAPGANGLGQIQGDGIALGDVTGDGVLDVVAGAASARVAGVADCGAVYVHAGGAGLRGARAPDAVLARPGAQLGERLCTSDGQGLLLGDVTGDGVLDVVAGSKLATLGGPRNVGVLCVWAGGGVPASAPSAVLSVPDARYLDLLGSQRGAQGVRLADVTGDGALDVLVGADVADVGGVQDAGAIYAFEGGPSLSGAVAPCARLRAPNPGRYDRFGPDRADGFRVADVTGDGRLEVIAVCSGASVGGANDAGALFVYRIEPATVPAAPTPSPAPLATLAVPGAAAGERLAELPNRGLYLADLTADGVLDLVTVSSGLVAGTGPVHVFAGGPLAGGAPGGIVAPVAWLTGPAESPYDPIGADGLVFADWTRDGTLDVLAACSGSDLAAPDAGAIHLFAGGGGLAGARAPSATLLASGAGAGDRLVLSALADVTGDGVADVVARAAADVDGVLDVGAIHVFDGAGPLAGRVPPSAVLVPPELVELENLSPRRFADVTGDGVLDVVAQADTGGLDVPNPGVILVYAGGALRGRTFPGALLSAPLARSGDLMRLAAVADVSGDGVPDLLGATWRADVGGVRDTGALFLFASGAWGAPGVLAVPGAMPDDRLAR